MTSIYYTFKGDLLIVISELITTGSLKEYTTIIRKITTINRFLAKIKLPRLIVLKHWCKMILQGIKYLHKIGLIHGMLSCNSYYVNSNSGIVKIGDLGS